MFTQLATASGDNTCTHPHDHNMRALMSLRCTALMSQHHYAALLSLHCYHCTAITALLSLYCYRCTANCSPNSQFVLRKLPNLHSLLRCTVRAWPRQPVGQLVPLWLSVDLRPVTATAERHAPDRLHGGACGINSLRLRASGARCFLLVARLVMALSAAAWHSHRL